MNKELISYQKLNRILTRFQMKCAEYNNGYNPINKILDLLFESINEERELDGDS